MTEKIFSSEELLSGVVLLIDKQKEWTSFDIVNKVRSQIKYRKNIPKIKVGHAGTLDPLATGLLIVCTGKKTKELYKYQEESKEYIALMKLGETTPSYDLETDVDKTFSIGHIKDEDIYRVADKFIGNIEQLPPVYSAKRVNGKRAYNSARKGKEIELQAVNIKIHNIEITGIKLPFVEFKVLCSKGTYIRALARDLGLALNSGAHLTELRRTKIGQFHVNDAITVDVFEKML